MQKQAERNVKKEEKRGDEIGSEMSRNRAKKRKRKTLTVAGFFTPEVAKGGEDRQIFLCRR